jgi:UDP-N-acetylmuramate-alanine ligase
MGHNDAHFVPELKEITRILKESLKPGDVLLVLSAGNADQVSAQVYASLSQVG